MPDATKNYFLLFSLSKCPLITSRADLYFKAVTVVQHDLIF